MNVLENYNEALDKRAAQERRMAAQAKSRGDEREHSMHLMQASMLGDMLKVMGRVSHDGSRPGMLSAQIAALQKEAEAQQAKGDYDAADRARVKANIIEWAKNTLENLENE